jgi:hypothetical protein
MSTNAAPMFKSFRSQEIGSRPYIPIAASFAEGRSLRWSDIHRMFDCFISNEVVIRDISCIPKLDELYPFEWIQHGPGVLQAECVLPGNKTALLFQMDIHSTTFDVYDNGALTFHLETTSSQTGTVTEPFNDTRAGLMCFQHDGIIKTLGMWSERRKRSDCCYYDVEQLGHLYSGNRVPEIWGDDCGMIWDVFDEGDLSLVKLRQEGVGIFHIRVNGL